MLDLDGIQVYIYERVMNHHKVVISFKWGLLGLGVKIQVLDQNIYLVARVNICKIDTRVFSSTTNHLEEIN